MKFSRSMKFKTAILITVPVCMLLILAGIWISIQIRAIYSDITVKSRELADARSDQIGAVLSDALSYTLSLRAVSRLRNGLLQNHVDALHDIARFKPELIDDIMYVQPDGKYTMSAGQQNDMSEKDYFKLLNSSSSDYIITSPIMSPTKNYPIVGIIVKMTDDTGSFSGYVGSIVKLEALSKICMDVNFGKNGYGWLVDQTGLVLAFPDQSQVLSLNISDADEKLGYKGLSSLAAAMKSMPDDNSASYSYFTKPDGKKYITFYSKVQESPGWVFGMTMSDTEYMEKQHQTSFILYLLIVLCTIVVIILSIIIARGITKPVIFAQKAFSQLATGSADLTAQIKLVRHDEIGLLVASFNQFLEKLREIIINMKKEQENLQSMNTRLKNTSDATESASRLLVQTVSSVKKETDHQTGLANESAAGVNEIAANIESLDNLINSLAASITQASAAIEQMIHNISSVSASMGKMSEEFSEVTKAADGGHKTFESMATMIEKIVSRSEVLLDVNKTISEISAMTNLLSMNAAIESAHAGEAGKGFAVVADEIRRLAENSEKQSKLIAKELTDMQDAISDIAAASEISGKSFDTMTDRINGTESLVAQIKQALQEQTEGSNQILEALKNMNDISTQVRTGAGEMRTGNQTILTAMNSLESATGEIGSSMSNLEESGKELTANTDELMKITGISATAVQHMDESIGKFTV